MLAYQGSEMNTILQEIFQIYLTAELFSPVPPNTPPWLSLGCCPSGFWKWRAELPHPWPLPSHQAASPASASWAPFLVLLVDQPLRANSFFIRVICIANRPSKPCCQRGKLFCV